MTASSRYGRPFLWLGGSPPSAREARRFQIGAYLYAATDYGTNRSMRKVAERASISRHLCSIGKRFKIRNTKKRSPCPIGGRCCEAARSCSSVETFLVERARALGFLRSHGRDFRFQNRDARSTTRSTNTRRRRKTLGPPASFLVLAEFYPLPFPRLRRRVEFAGNGNAEAAGNNKAISGMEKKLPAY